MFGLRVYIHSKRLKEDDKIKQPSLNIKTGWELHDYILTPIIYWLRILNNPIHMGMGEVFPVSLFTFKKVSWKECRFLHQKRFGQVDSKCQDTSSLNRKVLSVQTIPKRVERGGNTYSVSSIVWQKSVFSDRVTLNVRLDYVSFFLGDL